MKSEQEEIEINSGEVLLSMLEKICFVRGLPNMSRNSMSVYVLKLISLRKSGSFAVFIDFQTRKI